MVRHYDRESLEFQATTLHVFSHYFAKLRSRRQPIRAISEACSNAHTLPSIIAPEKMEVGLAPFGAPCCAKCGCNGAASSLPWPVMTTFSMRRSRRGRRTPRQASAPRWRRIFRPQRDRIFALLFMRAKNETAYRTSLPSGPCAAGPIAARETGSIAGRSHFSNLCFGILEVCVNMLSARTPGANARPEQRPGENNLDFCTSD